MAAIGSGRGIMDSQNQVQSDTVDRLKVLYPNVNEDETPLPRSWSTKDKFSYIGLSQNNLRVHYKGHELSGSHNKINQEILDVQRDQFRKCFKRAQSLLLHEVINEVDMELKKRNRFATTEGTRSQ
ncbi:hypothetical protein SFRURICE_009955 [Spodoptera frugiperda]|nr:hypothetical protein SFRURICE_009955 [Spodoptera frugiperda]